MRIPATTFAHGLRVKGYVIDFGALPSGVRTVMMAVESGDNQGFFIEKLLSEVTIIDWQETLESSQTDEKSQANVNMTVDGWNKARY